MSLGQQRRQLQLMVLFAYGAVPAALVYAVATAGPWGWGWLGNTVVATLLLSWFAIFGNWSWVGYAWRWLFPLALIAAAGYSAGRRGAMVAAVLLLAPLAVAAVRRRIRPLPAGAIPLQWPLWAGRAYIAHGGESASLNQHHRVPAQRYALDIVALGWTSARCRGFYPADLQRYRIYGCDVHSPCDGVVTAAEGVLPDLTPPERDRRHPAGNCVIVEYSPGVFVGCAHLQAGSITVQAGERVEAGQLLGRVGNSGNTSEPHLHLQAKRGGSPDSLLDGDGLPMLFGGRFLRRNDCVRGRPERNSA